jgi:hypothetical protein
MQWLKMQFISKLWPKSAKIIAFSTQKGAENYEHIFNDNSPIFSRKVVKVGKTVPIVYLHILSLNFWHSK